MTGPLADFRVLDLTSVIMGPTATHVLADFGADVIKVEPPEGDVMRQSGPCAHAGMGHFFLTANRNKRSVALDLKSALGRAALLRLAVRADVLVYNIRPQAMKRLALSYEDVRQVNPGIVYAGAFGFSQRGPYAARPAYDDLIQGMAGLPWLSAQAGAEVPRYAPVVLADRIVGLQVANAILAALLHRAATGEGQRVDVPMFESMAALVLGEHLAGQLYEPAQGPYGYQRSLAHDRRPLRTTDGYICVMVYSDKQWRGFLESIDRARLFTEDARFATHSARVANIGHVYAFLSDTIAQRSTAEWLEVLSAADIPCSRMNSIEDIVADDHLRATGFFRTVEHPTEGRMLETAIPSEWSATPPENRYGAPTVGQHTREVLDEHGFEPAEIDALVAAGRSGGSR